MEKKDAVYRRVSSDSQTTASQDLELRRWAATNAPDALWFEDCISGTKSERPGLNGLLEELQAGHVGRVIVWSLSRLGRSCRHLLDLLEEFRRNDIQFISLRESIDLKSAFGRCVFAILASFAELENEQRRERQAAGIAAARSAGKTWGGSKAGRLLKVTMAKAKEVRKLAAADVPVAAIARATGLSRPTVYKLLKNDRQDNGQTAADRQGADSRKTPPPT